MIKWLLIFLGLSLGALVAVAHLGRVAHLAMIPGIAPPSWTAFLTPDTGLTRGRSRPLAGATLSWAMAPLGLSAPVWNADLRAPGGVADIQVWPGLQGADIALQRATVDLAAIMPPEYGVSGDVLLTEGQADLPWAARRLSSLTVTGRALDLHVQGVPLGAFDLMIEAAQPTWRARLSSVANNPVTAQAAFEGLSGAAALQVTLTVADTPDLPDQMRTILQRTAKRDGDGWSLRRRIVLPRALP